MSALRLLLAAAVVIVAVWTTGLSGAAMTDTETEAPASFGGGTLELAVGDGAASSLDAAAMRPGQTRTSTYELRNEGTVPATLSAGIRDRVDAPAATPLSAVLELRVEDCGADAACAVPTSAYAGSLEDFESAALGTIAADGSRHVRVTLAWAADKADPARQGASAAATLVWNAVAGASAP